LQLGGVCALVLLLPDSWEVAHSVALAGLVVDELGGTDLISSREEVEGGCAGVCCPGDACRAQSAGSTVQHTWFEHACMIRAAAYNIFAHRMRSNRCLTCTCYEVLLQACVHIACQRSMSRHHNDAAQRHSRAVSQTKLTSLMTVLRFGSWCGQCKQPLLLSAAVPIIAPAHSATRHAATRSLPAIMTMLVGLPRALGYQLSLSHLKKLRPAFLAQQL
jgi:hypothetical protein